MILHLKETAKFDNPRRLVLANRNDSTIYVSDCHISEFPTGSYVFLSTTSTLVKCKDLFLKNIYSETVTSVISIKYFTSCKVWFRSRLIA